MITFECTKSERWYIGMIVKRAIRDIEWAGELYDLDTQALEAMISLVHSNSCPLDLKKLLDFELVEFSHDMSGIHNCLYTDTGHLGGNFWPKCAQPVKQDSSND